MFRFLSLFCCAGLVVTSAQTPRIAGYPPGLNLSAAAGSNPTIQPIAVSLEDQSARWTASGITGWLILSANEGVGSTTLTATADTSGLPPGLYTDTVRLQLADGSAARGSAAVVVTLRLGIAAAAAAPSEWHVSPGGAPSGDGSPGNPWDIVTALSSGG